IRGGKRRVQKTEDHMKNAPRDAQTADRHGRGAGIPCHRVRRERQSKAPGHWPCSPPCSPLRLPPRILRPRLARWISPPLLAQILSPPALLLLSVPVRVLRPLSYGIPAKPKSGAGKRGACPDPEGSGHAVAGTIDGRHPQRGYLVDTILRDAVTGKAVTFLIALCGSLSFLPQLATVTNGSSSPMVRIERESGQYPWGTTRLQNKDRGQAAAALRQPHKQDTTRLASLRRQGG